MRWLAGSPSETNAAYCSHCMAARGEEDFCADCPAHEHLSLLPENADAARVFHRAWRQWHTSSYSVGEGQNQKVYSLPFAPRMEAYEAIARAMNVEWTDELLNQLQLMEAERIKAERERCDAGNP